MKFFPWHCDNILSEKNETATIPWKIPLNPNYLRICGKYVFKQQIWLCPHSFWILLLTLNAEIAQSNWMFQTCDTFSKNSKTTSSVFWKALIWRKQAPQPKICSNATISCNFCGLRHSKQHCLRHCLLLSYSSNLGCFFCGLGTFAFMFFNAEIGHSARPPQNLER